MASDDRGSAPPSALSALDRPVGINDLPDEVLVAVLERLVSTPRSAARLAPVCKHWNRVLSDPVIWKKFNLYPVRHALSPRMFTQLCQRYFCIEELNICGCRKVSTRDLLAVAPVLRSLRALHVINVGHGFLQPDAFLTQLGARLHTLSTQCIKLDAFERVLQLCPELRVLRVVPLGGFSYSHSDDWAPIRKFGALAAHVPHLRELYLHSATPPAQAVFSFAMRLPELEVLHAPTWNNPSFSMDAVLSDSPVLPCRLRVLRTSMIAATDQDFDALFARIGSNLEELMVTAPGNGSWTPTNAVQLIAAHCPRLTWLDYTGHNQGIMGDQDATALSALPLRCVILRSSSWSWKSTHFTSVASFLSDCTTLRAFACQRLDSAVVASRRPDVIDLGSDLATQIHWTAELKQIMADELDTDAISGHEAAPEFERVQDESTIDANGDVISGLFD